MVLGLISNKGRGGDYFPKRFFFGGGLRWEGRGASWQALLKARHTKFVGFLGNSLQLGLERSQGGSGRHNLGGTISPSFKWFDMVSSWGMGQGGRSMGLLD